MRRGGVLIVAAGCNSIFGVDELEFGGADATTSTSASGGGSGGSGGAADGGAGRGEAGKPAPYCGDGSIDSDEECDDGNDSDDDGCAGCVVACSGIYAVKDPSTFHCYMAVTAEYSWDEARARCFLAGPGVDLFAPSSEAERELILDEIPIPGDFTAWTCGNDGTVEGSYEWANGEMWTDPPWASGEPTGNNNQNCILGSSSGTIADAPCSEPHAYVCERTPAGLVSGGS
jgi:cysteine-rich repeat protein